MNGPRPKVSVLTAFGGFLPECRLGPHRGGLLDQARHQLA
jgi:hypothetical protein